MEVLTETVKVIVEKIVGYTITAVGRQMGYLIRYKKNVDNLRNEVVELEDDRKKLKLTSRGGRHVFRRSIQRYKNSLQRKAKQS